MGGSGFAIDMIRKVRANRELRKATLGKYRNRLRDLKSRKVKGNKVSSSVSFKEYTDDERSRMRAEIRLEKSSQNRVSWFWSILISLAVVAIGYWVFETIRHAMG